MINIGIIGCGKVAQIRHIPEYADNPDANLYGFYDINQERAAELAEKYNCKYYPSAEAMLADPFIQAVSVCTANHDHAAISIAALNAGKHVLCEKPMAVTYAECEAMVKAANDNQRKLMIGHNQRLAAAHVKAKELLTEGAIGRIISARTVFGHAGPETWSVDAGKNVWFFDRNRAAMGVMADLGVHKTDLLQYLCDSRISKVTARTMTLDKTDSSGKLISVDDHAFCIYEMENGIAAVMIVSWSYYGMEDNSTVLYGTEGIMRIYDDPMHSIVVINKSGEKAFYDVEAIQTNDNQTKSGIIDLWMEALTQDKKPAISGEEVLHCMRAVFAALESNKQGKTMCIQ